MSPETKVTDLTEPPLTSVAARLCDLPPASESLEVRSRRDRQRKLSMEEDEEESLLTRQMWQQDGGPLKVDRDRGEGNQHWEWGTGGTQERETWEQKNSLGQAEMQTSGSVRDKPRKT